MHVSTVCIKGLASGILRTYPGPSQLRIYGIVNVDGISEIRCVSEIRFRYSE